MEYYIKKSAANNDPDPQIEKEGEREREREREYQVIEDCQHIFFCSLFIPFLFKSHDAAQQSTNSGKLYRY
jgi:hypothetical protein